MDTKHRTHDFSLAMYNTHTETTNAEKTFAEANYTREAENGAIQCLAPDYSLTTDSLTANSLTTDASDYDLSHYFESKFNTSMAEEALMNLDSHVSFFEIPIVFT